MRKVSCLKIKDEDEVVQKKPNSFGFFYHLSNPKV